MLSIHEAIHTPRDCSRISATLPSARRASARASAGDTPAASRISRLSFLGEGGGAGSGVRDAGSGFGSSDGGPVWRLENAANFSQQGIRRKRLLNESQSGLENAMPDDGIIGVA